MNNKSNNLNEFSIDELVNDLNMQKKRLAYLLTEAESIKSTISSIEEKMEKRFSTAPSYKSNIINCEKIETVTTTSQLSNSTEVEDVVIPDKPIIPKIPHIKGLQDLRFAIWSNLEELFHANNNYSNETITLSYPAFALTRLGKELILIKDEEQRSESEVDEAYSILETCKKIIEVKESDDIAGYEKYLKYFYEKYPLPEYPFDNEKPLDFFSSQSESIYASAYNYYYFLRSWAKEIDKIYQKELTKEYRFIEIDLETLTDTINSFFVEECLAPICELASMGFRLAIIPILDENIIYRPKRLAQTDVIYSLLYYDKYIDVPSMVDGNKSSEVPSYTYHGNIFVSGHYRQGHWREGKWVSGGYVKSYYRK